MLDITPITQALTQIAAAAILALGTWAVGRAIQWLGLKNSAQATAAVDGALEKAVTYGLQQVQAQIATNGWDHPQVKNDALAKALPYMTSHFNDTLKAAGVPVGDQGKMDSIVSEALDRAFPSAVAAAASSPATPPATAPKPPVNADLPVAPKLSQPTEQNAV